MPIINKVIEQKGPNMAPSYAPKSASLSISFNPLVFRAERETLTGLETYNRVEDKEERHV
jgi:hypothetical protein